MRARAASGELVAEVSDTGEGISSEDIPHIFNRFHRGEESRSRYLGGAGLGLTIAKGIVEALGGSIGVEGHVLIAPRVTFGVTNLATLSGSMLPTS